MKYLLPLISGAGYCNCLLPPIGGIVILELSIATDRLGKPALTEEPSVPHVFFMLLTWCMHVSLLEDAGCN